MTAPELSETERARLDAIEAAEPAPESLRERVARALWDEAEATAFLVACARDEERVKLREDRFRSLADAALAVINGEQ